MKFVIALAFCFSSSLFAAEANTGKPAPNFQLKGADGKPYSLAQFKGKNVVLEWFNNDCPYVKKHYNSKNMQTLQKTLTDKGTIWLTIASSASGKQGHMSEAEAQKIRADRGMANTALLLDGDSKVAREYGAKTTPHMYVVDKTGTLVYKGAIDDHPQADPATLKGAKNYVAAAIENINGGKPVDPSDTDSYGCSVKY
jgi:peroxiredoxin